MADARKCLTCLSEDIEGPWDGVYFCNGCGRSINEYGWSITAIRLRQQQQREKARRRDEAQRSQAHGSSSVRG